MSEVLTWTAPSSGTGPVLFQWAVVVTLVLGISNEWYAPLQTQAILESKLYLVIILTVVSSYLTTGTDSR